MTRALIVDDKEFVVARLKELSKGKQMNTTYWLAKAIEEKGLIKASYAPNPAGRGRTIKIYDLTTKGKRLLDVVTKKEEKEKEERKLLREAMAFIKKQKASRRSKETVSEKEENNEASETVAKVSKRRKVA